MHHDGVRMVQPRRDPGFGLRTTEHPPGRRVVGRVDRQLLDGHDPVEPFVAGPPHHARGTPADRREQPVPAADHRALVTHHAFSRPVRGLRGW